MEGNEASYTKSNNSEPLFPLESVHVTLTLCLFSAMTELFMKSNNLVTFLLNDQLILLRLQLLFVSLEFTNILPL